jgi:small neutral amino acid transporter SnatA (MarC family)
MVKAGGTWFYVGMAIFAILFSIAAFGPSLMQTSQRPGPLTALLAAHGAVFFTWLLFFLAQSMLARTGRLALHRQLGMLSAILAAAMVVLGYQVTIEMARRGLT